MSSAFQIRAGDHDAAAFGHLAPVEAAAHGVLDRMERRRPGVWRDDHVDIDGHLDGHVFGHGGGVRQRQAVRKVVVHG